MILLWGLPDDTPVTRIADELRRLNAAVCFLDQRRYTRTTGELHLDNGTCSGRIAADDQRIDLDTVTGAYLRPYPLPPATNHRHRPRRGTRSAHPDLGRNHPTRDGRDQPA